MGVLDGIEGWSSSWERTAIPDGIKVGSLVGLLMGSGNDSLVGSEGIRQNLSGDTLGKGVRRDGSMIISQFNYRIIGK